MDDVILGDTPDEDAVPPLPAALVAKREKHCSFYSCRSAMLLGLRFPPSSLAGIVEIRELVPVACLWQGNNAQATRCYEWRFLTSQCLSTKFRAAGCALLPERILRCRLIQTLRLYYTNFAGAKPPWQIRKKGPYLNARDDSETRK
jgi:hypothetical protein